MQNLSVHEPGGAGISLRRKIDVIFAVLTLLVLGIFVTVEVQATRSSIREEMEASNRISTQLLSRIGAGYDRSTMPQLARFLRQTGRVRASEVQLTDDAGSMLYVSPPPTYKAGRFAPEWYTDMVAPRIAPTVIRLDGGTLRVTMNPSRAVLDSWDDLKAILISQGVLLLAADLLVFWLVGRWLAPLEKISRGLRQMEAGQHHIRLPALPGKEMHEMGRTFNRMAQAVEENMQVRQAEADAQARLRIQRESTRLLNARIEDERTALARELHDELGQSLTAMRSIAQSLLQNPQLQGGSGEQAARLLFDTASTTYDAMHRMIPRLRPMQLDGMGLIDAVRDLVTDLQIKHAPLRIALTVAQPVPALPDTLEISAFRIVQEALTNVVRHAGATEVALQFVLHPDQDQLEIVVADNGAVDLAALQKSGHYGVLGMQERAESLAGSVTFAVGAGGGLEVRVRLPLSGPDPALDTTRADDAARLSEAAA
ncbi:MAG: HAMP domain-containing protein [Herminiimonas sp.]|nr:HAMP domain-containing protein [Herminiimonas sp.]